VNDPDAFPFTVVASQRWPGWEVIICTRWSKPAVVGWYRAGHAGDQARQAKDLEKLRDLWEQTTSRRQQTRQALAALKESNPHDY